MIVSLIRLKERFISQSVALIVCDAISDFIKKFISFTFSVGELLFLYASIRFSIDAAGGL